MKGISFLEDEEFVQSQKKLLCGYNKSNVYLDYAGAGLASTLQINSVMCELNATMMSNPHSLSKVGLSTDQIVNQARYEVLKFVGRPETLNANMKYDYDVVFTSGSTAGIKLIGDLFDKSPFSRFYYSLNSHTSVVGLRELFENAVCFPSKIVEQIANNSADCSDGGVNSNSFNDNQSENKIRVNHLVAIPGECNFTGRAVQNFSNVGAFLQNHQQNLNEWLISRNASVIKERNSVSANAEHNIYWLLDASKYVSEFPLNLFCESEVNPPHFVVLSFYKIFGYPTGVGALLIRRSISSNECSNNLENIPSGLQLCGKYFGGGSVNMVVADSNYIVRRGRYLPDTGNVLPLRRDPIMNDAYVRSLEAGTLNYHGIAALRHGFRHIQSYGGMYRISRYIQVLTSYILREMSFLCYHNSDDNPMFSPSQPLCRVYGHPEYRSAFVNSSSGGAESRINQVAYATDNADSAMVNGGIIAFNMLTRYGDIIGYSKVAKRAEDWNISLRTGNNVYYRQSKCDSIYVGCFCNTGACQEMLGMTSADLIGNYLSGRTCGDAVAGAEPTDVINGKPTGGVRISVGMYTTLEDCNRFLDFLRDFLKNEELVMVSSTAIFSRESVRICGSNPLPTVSPASNIVLTRIFIYPIKSCSGIEVTGSIWPIDPKTLSLWLDRRFVLCTKYYEGVPRRAITQKNYPKMSLISVNLGYIYGYLAEDQCEVRRCESPNDIYNIMQSVVYGRSDYSPVLIVSASNMEDLIVPITSGALGGVLVKVCGRSCAGALVSGVSGSVNEWFGQYLGVECELIQSSEFSEMRPGKSVKTYANDAPFLLISENRVKEFAEACVGYGETQRLTSKVTCETFRPNFVVNFMENVSGYEDMWTKFQIPCFTLSNGTELANSMSRWEDDLLLQIVGPCTRCNVINIVQSTSSIQGISGCDQCTHTGVDGKVSVDSSNSGFMTNAILSSLVKFRASLEPAASSVTSTETPVQSSLYFGQFCEILNCNDDKKWLFIQANTSVSI